MKFTMLVLLVMEVSAKVEYHGNQVWRVHFNSASELKSISETVHKHGLDIWSQSIQHVDIRIDPNIRTEMDSTFSKMGVSYDVMIENVQSLIDEESKTLSKRQEGEFNFEDYNTFADIQQYLDDVGLMTDNARVIRFGSTIEGRSMTQIRFSNGPGKSAIWIDCGIHARDWISTATCLYGVNQFSRGNPNFTKLLDSYDVHISPVVNPDGYEYSWNVDRFWRKNRRQVQAICSGVDLNRNFDSDFGGPGTSGLPCSDIYHGPSAFSELETQAIRDAINDGVYVAAYSLRAYSQLWMYPYGYTSHSPADLAALDANAAIGVAALEAVHGTQYDRGTIADTIYLVSGGLIDWTYDSARIAYSFTLALRDQGNYGFLLPKEYITPTAEETWAGMIAAILAI